MGRLRPVRSGPGFSLPFVLLAALVMLVGGLMLAMRSSDGLLSTLLQRESNDARDAAETGLNRIVGELNKPRNRGLLAKDEAAEDPAGYLWTDADAEASANPCRTDGPNLGGNTTIGANAAGANNTGTPYQTVLLDANGAVVTDVNQAARSYRLLWVKRQPLKTSEGKSTLRIFDSTGRGSVRLAVEGSVIRRGAPISTVVLEEELQLVPKCCDVSFGGKHGNTDYAANADGISVCIPLGMGFLAGAAWDDTGSMTLNGNASVVDNSGEPVDELFCIATDDEHCEFKATSTDYTLRTIHPDTFQTPANAAAALTAESLSGNTKLAPPFLACATSGSTPAPVHLRDCPGGEVTINAAATAAQLPNAFCAEQTNGVSQPEIHCKLSDFDYGQLQVKVKSIAQDGKRRPIRFFFPLSDASAHGAVVRSAGNGTLRHEFSTDATDKGSGADFALIGCSDCGKQTITLSGTPDGLSLFAWFPHGDVTVTGTANYEGVLWANTITSNGGVNWTISSPALLSALDMVGFGLSGDRNPPIYDWVARSVRTFRWFGS